MAGKDARVQVYLVTKIASKILLQNNEKKHKANYKCIHKEYLISTPILKNTFVLQKQVFSLRTASGRADVACRVLPYLRRDGGFYIAWLSSVFLPPTPSLPQQREQHSAFRSEIRSPSDNTESLCEPGMSWGRYKSLKINPPKNHKLRSRNPPSQHLLFTIPLFLGISWF